MITMLSTADNYSYRITESSSLTSGPGALELIVILYLATILVTMIGMWKMFGKAGIPGILAIIPIVNLFFLPKVGGKPQWWALLLLIPVVNIVISVLIFIAISERFDRGIGTVLGLIFLTPIFVCILGFGSAKWSPAPAMN